MIISTIIGCLALATILGLAITYIVKLKKGGAKCIGCPYACECNKQCK
ncbi:MAG: hypothetical protein PHS19_02985 [Eubacteriales bacterium]|nr:hypothetical protein [Eubacteriales bacterium]